MPTQASAANSAKVPRPAPGNTPSTVRHSAANISAQIIRPFEMASCTFWIGLFHKGKLAPTDLWAKESVYSLFEEAASSGIAEAGPLMLSDSIKTPARFIYLLPEPPPNRTEWIQQIIDTLKTWSPQRVGIYISPSMMDSAQFRVLLTEIISGLVQSTTINEYCLMPGKFGTNSILNALLELKEELSTIGIPFKIFH
jgi:hypothetical protein